MGGVIIAGHTQYKAAKQLKLKEVPIVVADKLTKEQVNAYRLADNKVGELANWDTKKLDDELQALLDQIDMTDFGFDENIEFDPADDIDVDLETDDKDKKLIQVTCPNCGEVFTVDNKGTICN